MKMTKKTMVGFAAVLSLSVLSLTGCASMFSGKTQEVTFNSKPQGAEILVGTKTCTAPCKMQLTKDKMYLEVSATKAGYQKEKINVVASLDPWFYGNIFNYGVGCIVDYVNGSYVKYDPEYLVQLEKK